MAYTQKNNPFKQKVSVDTPPKTNQNNIDLANRLNKVKYEMGYTYPITSKENIKKAAIEDVNSMGENWHTGYTSFTTGKKTKKQLENEYVSNQIQSQLDKTAQTEKERLELYNQDLINRDGKPTDEDLRFIKTAKEAGGDTFNKIMSLPKNTLINFQNDVIRVGKSFAGKKLDENPITTLNEVRKLDLSGFKQYLTKADVSADDIKKIVTSQLNNLPDLNKDGTPDAFEGLKGNILRKGINTVVDMKLKSLK